MTAIPLPPLSRCEELEDREIFENFSDVKKNLKDDFETPEIVRKRMSRLSQNLQSVSSDTMKVYLRLRPFSNEEISNGEDQGCMKLSDDRSTLTLIPPKDSRMFKVSSRGVGDTIRHYTFSQIFDRNVKQEEFFNATALPFVKDFIEGNNALLFTYGVTNAGKTYTFQGSPENEGILPRSIEVLFKEIEGKIIQNEIFCLKMAHNICINSEEEQSTQRSLKEEILTYANLIMNQTKSDSSQLEVSDATIESSRISEVSEVSQDETASTSLGSQSLDDSTMINDSLQGPVKYAVFISFFEIYKEQIYDLLDFVTEDKRQKRPVLRLADDSKGIPYVKGLREIQVSSKEEVHKILSVGRRNLHIAATKLNKGSSRSHCIFTISLVQVMDIPEPHTARVSKISFCDLAGSERTAKTKEVGDRLKEASKINTSLMNLGRCIEALRYNQLHRIDKHNQRVIPFRESRLTRLFQNFLLGQGRACMVINANMCASAFDENAHVLQFSAIAREVQIVNKVKPAVPVKKSRSTLFEKKPASKELVKKKARATIMWENGHSPIKEEAEQEGSDDDDDVDDEEEEDEEEESEDEQPKTEMDIAFWKDREDKFREVIEMLKSALIEQQKVNKQSEMQIRKEIVSSFHDQIVQIEKKNETRIEDTIELLEVEQEKRMGVVARLAALDRDGMEKDWEKKHWEIVVKNNNIEKELQQSQELQNSMMSELETLKSNCTSSELENNILKIEVKKRDEEVATLQRKLQRNRHSSTALEENLFIEDLQKENGEGRSIIQSQLEEIEEMRRRVEEVEDENEKLQESKVRADDLEISLGKMSSEVSQLKDEISHKEAEIAEKQDIINLKNEKLQESKIRADDLEISLGKMNSEVSQLKDEISHKEADIAKLSQNRKSVDQDLISLKKEKERECKRADDLEISLGKMTYEVSQLKDEISHKEADIAELSQKRKNVDQDLINLKKEKERECKRADDLEISLGKMSSEVSQLKDEISHKEADSAELSQKRKNIDQDLINLKREKEREGKTYAEEKRLLEGKIQSKDLEITKLNEENQKVTQKRNELKDVMAELQMNIQKYDQEKGDIEKLKNEQKNIIERNEEEKKSILQEHNKLKDEVVELKINIQKSEDEKSRSNAELENFKATMIEMEKTQIEQQKVIKQTDEEKKNVQQDLNKLKTDTAGLQKDIHRLEKEKIALTAERDEAEISRSKLADALEMCNIQEKKLKQSSHEVENDHHQKISELKDMRIRDLNDAEKEKETLNKEITELKNEIKNAEVVKEKEMKKLRDERDCIVEALESQINNKKITTDMLQKNLDEQMARSVQMKSQNAKYKAEISHLEKQQEEASHRQKLSSRKSVSASALTSPKPAIKQEPLSPRVPCSQKIPPSPIVSIERIEKSLEDKTISTSESESAYGVLGTKKDKSGNSTRQTRKMSIRHSSTENDGEKETESIPRKIRRTTRSVKKKSTSERIIKTDVSDGVLDDSELMRVTGHSQQFPQSTMEIDVTPQLTKKATKSRKRAAKTKADQEKDNGDGLSRTKSTRRKTRAASNKNDDENEEETLASAASKNLSKVGGMIKNSPVGQAFKKIEEVISPAMKSPVKSRYKIDDQSRQARRLRKLHTDDISLPLEATPPEDPRPGQVHSVSDTPARMMRRLRNRK